METAKATIVKEDMLQASRFRHAAKEFDPGRLIPQEDFEFILETGRLSPSSFGFEPWKFVVLQNKGLREKLLPTTWGAQKTLPTASHFLLVLSRQPADLTAGSAYIQGMLKDVKQLPEDVAAGMSQAYDAFLRSDFGLLGNDRALFEWGCRQAYIALGNMMTAAAQIGIDSCPIEGFNKNATEALLAQEGLLDPQHFGLACMAAFGYRVREPRPKTRRPLEDVVSWVE